MNRSLIILIILLSVNIPVLAQVDTAWVRRYNGPANGNDAATDMVVDGSGNSYVCGYSFDNNTSFDYAVIKYYSNGDTAWVRRYNGPANLDDYARAIAIDGSGNVYVTGRSYSTWAESDCATIKYNAVGDSVWAHVYNGSGDGNDWGNDIIADGSGNAYVVGSSLGAGTSADFITIKYNSGGVMEWAKTYNGPVNSIDEANAIAMTNSASYVYVTGYSYGGSTVGYDYATVKYFHNGDSIWVERYNGPANGNDEASDIAVDGAGNAYVTGGSVGINTACDYTTIRYFPNGGAAWVSRYDGPSSDIDSARAITVDNVFVYVTGISYDTTTSDDWVTIKYNFWDGDTAWVRRYDGGVFNFDWANDIAVDGSGNVFAAGFSYEYFQLQNYTCVKYTSNGTVAWTASYNGPANQDDFAAAVGLDYYNNVYLSGQSNGGGSTYDFATMKYVPIISGVDNSVGSEVNPSGFMLSRNFPNPFNQTTVIEFSLSQPGMINLDIYDIMGRKIRTYNSGSMSAGHHSVVWDGTSDSGESAASGLYFYRIQVNGHSETRTMLLLK